MELKSCPLCGGKIDERGWQCNYGDRIMTLNLKCEKCGTFFKFKSNWLVDSYSEAIEAWNRRIGEYREAILAVKSILHSAKPIDAVPVVRCKDCKHHYWEQEPCHGKTVHYCKLPHMRDVEVFKEFFCSWYIFHLSPVW